LSKFIFLKSFLFFCSDSYILQSQLDAIKDWMMRQSAKEASLDVELSRDLRMRDGASSSSSHSADASSNCGQPHSWIPDGLSLQEISYQREVP
jgi:hypothetical protein